jgi:hypothetical protein
MARVAVRVPERATCFTCGAALAEEAPFAMVGADRRPRWCCVDCMRDAIARHADAEREQLAILADMLRTPAYSPGPGGLDEA